MNYFEADMERKSIESFESYRKAHETAYPTYNEKEEAVKKAYKALVPRIGLKCTMVYYSDYRASTVVELISEKEIVVRHNKTKCLDWFAGQYEIYDELEGGEHVFTKRKNGTWIEKGQPTKDGVYLALHYHRHFIDPTF